MSFEESYYENTALWTSDSFGEADRQRVSTLADKLPIDVQTLLDVGCGNGLFLKHLSDLKGRCFSRLCGSDRSAAALVWVQTEKVRASVDSLPFANGEFDAVSCMEVLEHLPQARFISARDELSRIARKYILVSVPADENLRLSYTECTKCCCRFNPHYHLRTFSQQTMRHLFDDKGFTSREVFDMHPQMVVPTEIEVVLRFFGVVKRTMLRQPRPQMSDNAVCPACGYSTAAGREESSRCAVQPSRRVGMTIRSLLAVKSEWRWRGALYERM